MILSCVQQTVGQSKCQDEVQNISVDELIKEALKEVEEDPKCPNESSEPKDLFSLIEEELLDNMNTSIECNSKDSDVLYCDEENNPKICSEGKSPLMYFLILSSNILLRKSHMYVGK